MQEVSTEVKSDKKINFPEIIDGKINTEDFLQATRDVVQSVRTYSFQILTSNYMTVETFCSKYIIIRKHEKLICILDKLGKMFAPVRYDMQGNIDVSKY